jgi:hypothetical protein
MDDALIILVTLATVYALHLDTKTSTIVVLGVFLLNEIAKSHTLRLHLVNDANGLNESLILDAEMNGSKTLFMLDTGYAGALVISSSYLSVQHEFERGSVSQRYRESLAKLSKGVTDDMRHGAINRLIRYRECQSYTSGCTMTLAGIGSVVQQQADMLMCKPLRFKNSWGFFTTPGSKQKPSADVLVTNPLASSVHIMTCDYLLHSSPALICMKRQTLQLFLSPIITRMISTTFQFVDSYMVGGAFVVPIEIQGGEVLQVTMDTGAPGPLCLSSNAVHKLKHCTRPTKRKVHQGGVNGERICSDILYTSAIIGGISFKKIGVFVNDVEVDGVDGYMGLAVLRALDILILPDRVGFRKSGLSPELEFKRSASGSCTDAYACEL